MNLQEHDNNRFTKERDNIEKYLLRIMQRYFDVENNYTQESIEAIIVESLTRFKREILKEKGYLFSLNQMTGNISLTIQDFGGEYKFDKNTAFNKDFGEDADTICEGNDPRLYDRREPNHHVHVIDDVIGLRELLNSINVSPCSHIHKNKNVLDMIRYSGNLAEFDLQIIEALSQKLLKYCDNLQFKRKELSSYTKKQIEILDGYIISIRQDLDNAKQFIAESINWLDKAYKYITNNVDNFHDNQLSKLSEYVTKAQAAAILEYLKKAYTIVWEDYFPIPDGEITMTPVEEPYEDIASTDDSSSLLSIYNTGFTVGQNDSSGDFRWIWDNSLSSFKYLGNNYTDYPMFLNSKLYESYTHRVTLKSTNGDDDIISTIIAYDKDTGNHLSIICSCGDAGDDSGITTPSISLQYNFYKSNNKKIVSNVVIDPSYTTPTKNSAGGGGWAALSNGITVLIKKDKRHIQVWASLNGIGSWVPGDDNDIHPTEQPVFDINMDDFPELTSFPVKTNYGYGTHSQAYSFYQDVYFLGKHELKYPYGHTNVNESSNINITVPSSVISKIHNGKIKMFFRYIKDETEYQFPLPYYFKDNNGHNVVIQGSYTEDGNINIKMNLLSNVSLYATKDKNLYNNTIIAISDAVPEMTLFDINDTFKTVKVAKIDDIQKEQFIKTLLDNTHKYLFQGIAFSSDGTTIEYTDYDGNELQYTNMQNAPSINDLDLCYGSYMSYSLNDKMEIIKQDKLTIPVIFEYKIPRITEYFENPRIYYQVLGNKEGM